MTAGEAVNLLHKIKTRESMSTTPQWETDFDQTFYDGLIETDRQNVKDFISKALQQEREKTRTEIVAYLRTKYQKEEGDWMWEILETTCGLKTVLDQPKKE